MYPKKPQAIASSPAKGISLIEEGGKKFASSYYLLTLVAGGGRILGIHETPLASPDKGREVLEEEDVIAILPTLRQEVIIRAGRGIAMKAVQVRKEITKGGDKFYRIMKGGKEISSHVRLEEAYKRFEAEIA